MGCRWAAIQHPLYRLVKTVILNPIIDWEITANYGDLGDDTLKNFLPVGIAQGGIDKADNTSCVGCFKSSGTYGRGADPDATGVIGWLRVVGDYITVDDDTG